MTIGPPDDPFDLGIDLSRLRRRERDADEAHIDLLRNQVLELNKAVASLQRQMLAATNLLIGQQTAIIELQRTLFDLSQSVRFLAEKVDELRAALPKEG